MLEAVIFDKDGVLVDGEPLKARGWTTALNEYGIEADDRWFLDRVGITGEERKKLACKEFGISPEDAEKIFQRKREVYKQLSLEEPLVIPTSIEFLRRIERYDVKLAVASSDFRDSIEQQLKRMGVYDLFDVIVSGVDDLGKGRDKPRPDVYIWAAGRLNVSPRNCIAIEDTKNGVESANNAGMRCVGYHNPNSGNQDLSNAYFIINDLSKISFEKLKELMH